MASNPYVNKVDLANGTTLIDLSQDTATQADVAQGKYFHLPTGERVQGTASGGGGGTGGITQDQDGYLVLSPDGGGGGGGGLEYEEGTFTPSADIARPTINFLKTHTEPPSFVEMVREESEVYNQYENYRFTYHDWWRLLGEAASTSTSAYYAEVRYQYVTSTTSLSASGIVLPNNSDDTTDSDTNYPRYWVNESWFKPSSNSASRYWRAGRTYKWIAVWAPTT